MKKLTKKLISLILIEAFLYISIFPVWATPSDLLRPKSAAETGLVETLVQEARDGGNHVEKHYFVSETVLAIIRDLTRDEKPFLTVREALDWIDRNEHGIQRRFEELAALRKDTSKNGRIPSTTIMTALRKAGKITPIVTDKGFTDWIRAAGARDMAKRLHEFFAQIPNERFATPLAAMQWAREHLEAMRKRNLELSFSPQRHERLSIETVLDALWVSRKLPAGTLREELKWWGRTAGAFDLALRISPILDQISSPFEDAESAIEWVRAHYDEIMRINRQALNRREDGYLAYGTILASLWPAGKLDESVDIKRLKGWMRKAAAAEYARAEKETIETTIREAWDQTPEFNRARLKNRGYYFLYQAIWAAASGRFTRRDKTNKVISRDYFTEVMHFAMKWYGGALLTQLESAETAHDGGRKLAAVATLFLGLYPMFSAGAVFPQAPPAASDSVRVEEDKRITWEYRTLFREARAWLREGKKHESALAFMRGFLLKGAVVDLRENLEGGATSDSLYNTLAGYVEAVVLQDFDQRVATEVSSPIRLWVALQRDHGKGCDRAPADVATSLRQDLIALASAIPTVRRPKATPPDSTRAKDGGIRGLRIETLTAENQGRALEYWDEESAGRILDRRISFVARLEGKTVGYAINFIRPDPDMGAAFLEQSYLEVDEALQGRKIGRALMRATLELAVRENIPAVFAEVAKVNASMLAFHRLLGSEEVGEIPPSHIRFRINPQAALRRLSAGDGGGRRYPETNDLDALKIARAALAERTQDGKSNYPVDLSKEDDLLYRFVRRLEPIYGPILPHHRNRRNFNTVGGWRAYLDERIANGLPITEIALEKARSSTELQKLREIEEKEKIQLMIRYRTSSGNFSPSSAAVAKVLWHQFDPAKTINADVAAREVLEALDHSGLSEYEKLILIARFSINDRLGDRTKIFLRTTEGGKLLARFKKLVLRGVEGEPSPLRALLIHTPRVVRVQALHYLDAWLTLVPESANGLRKEAQHLRPHRDRLSKPGPLEHALWEKVAGALGLLEQTSTREIRLSFVEARVLISIPEGRSISPSRLGEEASIGGSELARLIGGLKKKGMVEVSEATGGISLTEQGRAFLEEDDAAKDGGSHQVNAAPILSSIGPSRHSETYP